MPTPSPRTPPKAPPPSLANFPIAPPAQVARTAMFEDMSDEEFRAFQKLQEVARYSDPDSTYYRIRKPSILGFVCTCVSLLIIYAAWSVWLYYLTRTRVWPLPRGPLNASDGLLHHLTTATKAFVAILGVLSLLIPLGLFLRTRVPGRMRSLTEFTGWICFCTVAGLIPLLIYYSFLCSMQDQAFSTSCDPSEEITAYFVGSTRGLNDDRTTATLFRTSDMSIPFAKYTLTKTGYNGAQFARTEGTGDYFRVTYAVHDDDAYATATAYTSEIDSGSITATGNLTEMVLSPLNFTLRSVGEVQLQPLNFRLVDNPPVAANGTVEGLGTIGGNVLLRSLATDPWSCRSLKLCARSIEDPDSRAKVLIPMGWALYKHAMYAFSC
ncbi:hypothetical protein AURDEDRAFT_165313 [Auricularia subglabra TFB-10046 SS5]|nr:hypothetical protein AURDEDRAFT_165313 [Auricularia subglabra TFB-10046 SS5]